MDTTIAERIAKLEKTNRVLVFVCSILVALPLLAGITAFKNSNEAIAEVVRAEKFELVVDGKVFASIEPGQGGGSLVLSDADGKHALIATSYGDGGGAILIAAKEEDGAILTLSSRSAGAQLQMEDPNHALQLSIQEAGASITIASKSGQTGLDFLADNLGANLTLASIKEKSIIEILTRAEGPHIKMNKEDKTVFSEPDDAN